LIFSILLLHECRINECDKISRKENYEAQHKEVKKSDFEDEVLETANDVQDLLEVRNAII